MTRYIALLRDINVGGNNKIIMSDLKASFEQQGFQNIVTYINSGNILFDSELDETAAKAVCEKLIAEDFGLEITICVISAADLSETLAHAPDWWGRAPDARHDVFLSSAYGYILTDAMVKNLQGQGDVSYHHSAECQHRFKVGRTDGRKTG